MSLAKPQALSIHGCAIRLKLNVGMSAPAADIAKALGFTPKAVAKLAQDSFAFATR